MVCYPVVCHRLTWTFFTCMCAHAAECRGKMPTTGNAGDCITRHTALLLHCFSGLLQNYLARDESHNAAGKMSASVWPQFLGWKSVKIIWTMQQMQVEKPELCLMCYSSFHYATDIYLLRNLIIIFYYYKNTKHNSTVIV